MTKVTILYGGLSAEREVSLVSGQAVADALSTLEFDVQLLDASGSFLAKLEDQKPDVVFNALHGRWGEDGCVQGALDLMGLRYTHSGVAASAIAMDKALTKTLVATAGLNCPEGVVTTVANARQIDAGFQKLVVKPVNEGSSVGVCFINSNETGQTPNWPETWKDDDLVLVEEYIPGLELTTAVMGDKALAVTEIDTSRVFYDYEAKYTQGGSQHQIPATIDASLEHKIMEQALAAHKVIGCSGVTRSDFRYDPETDRLAFLEINTQPGMTPLSLVPEQAAYIGIDFPSLCRWIVEEALI